MLYDSVLPELSGQRRLSDFEKTVLEFIRTNWPVTPLDLAEHFKEDLSSREAKRKASSKYAYYLKKLVEKQLVLSKRVGNALVVWPLLVEKYRVVHDILREDLR